MVDVFQLFIISLLFGGILASLAIGFSMLWKVMGAINVAHPSFALLSAYFSFSITRTGLDPLLSILIIVPIFFMIGMAFYRGILRRLKKSEITQGSMAITFGLMLVIESLIHGAYSANEKTIRVVNYLKGSVNLKIISLPKNYIVGFALSLVAIFVIYLILNRTYLGKAIRAVWQDKEGALLCGISFDRISHVACGLSFSLAAVGGICLAFIYTLYPTVHLNWIFLMFLITVLGGLGSIKGAIVGGVLVSLTINLTSVYIANMWSTPAIIIMLLIVLMFRPSGLFKT